MAFLRSKTVMVSVFVAVFFIFVCVFPAYISAAEQQAAPTSPFTKLQIIKIPAKAPLNPTVSPYRKTVDLQSGLITYYDYQMLRPIPDHKWNLADLSGPAGVLPWRLFWKIVVRNNGTGKAENFVVNIHSSYPDFYSPTYNLVYSDDNVTLTLEPGEAAELRRGWGPFYPRPNLVGKTATMTVKADSTTKFVESNETNNVVTNWVTFVK